MTAHLEPHELHARAVLTERQLAVWLLSRRGASQRTIAAWLGIERATVRDHLERARRRLAEAGEIA